MVKKAPGEPDPAHARTSTATLLVLRAELYWIVLALLLAGGGVLFLLSNRSWGADVAGILTLPVEVLALAIPILLAKGVISVHEGENRLARHPVRQMAFTVVVAMLVGGGWYLHEREPHPFKFLSKVVRIGYVSPGYPGWNEGVSSNRRGFDVSVAQALLDYFPDIESIDWVELETLDQRIDALRKPWGQKEKPPVHLVISNFSITEDRKRLIDFAGPYFNDMEGFLTHDRTATHPTDIHEACVPEGSTAAQRLPRMAMAVKRMDSVDACLRAFFSRADPGLSVSTDWAILQGFAARYGHEIPTFIARGDEQYGVGLPNNSPKLCAAVNEALERFLRGGWDVQFKNTLGKLGIQVGDRHPQSVDPCEPAAPWLK